MGYASGIGIISAESFSLFGLLLALPILLVRVAGWTSQAAGLFILPLTLVMALTGPFAGRLADRRGFRLPCALGMGFAAGGGAIIASAGSTGLTNQTWWVLGAGLILVGLGMGLTQSPVTAAVIHVVNEDQVGVATGIFHMSRFIAGSLGSTVFGLIIELDRNGIYAGFTHSMIALIGVLGLAFIIAFGLPGGPRASMETVPG
jgi:MFS family permease